VRKENKLAVRPPGECKFLIARRELIPRCITFTAAERIPDSRTSGAVAPSHGIP